MKTDRQAKLRKNGMGMKEKKGKGLREVKGGRNIMEVTMEGSKVSITRNVVKQYIVVSFTTNVVCFRSVTNI